MGKVPVTTSGLVTYEVPVPPYDVPRVLVMTDTSRLGISHSRRRST